MSNLVIVAIPKKDDYVWKISSEKVPHMTLLFLGDPTQNSDVTKISEFLEHAASTVLYPFYMEVSDRGTLGPDEADVLFFEGSYDLPEIRNFRSQLLKNDNIKKAYDSAEQYAGWTPHLTLGYPATPAKPDDRDYPGIYSVCFDKIALWYGDYEGPEFKLQSQYLKHPEEVYMSDVMEVVDNLLKHHGVKGMRWGVRNAVRNKVTQIKDKSFEKKANTINNKIDLHNRAGELMHKHGDMERINNKPEYVKAAEDGTLLNDFHPTTQKYTREYMSIYVKRLNEAAAEVGTNKSGTKKYTVKENNDFLGFTVSTSDVQHADAGSFNVLFVKNKKGVITDLKIQDVAKHGEDMVSNILVHHGVKGMRWGVRKSSPSSATVEQHGKKLKAKGGTGQAPHPDAVQAKQIHQTAKKSGLHSLSNEELTILQNRMNLEQNVSRLSSNQPKHGPVVKSQGAAKKFITKLLIDTGKESVTRVAKDKANKEVGKMLAEKERKKS